MIWERYRQQGGTLPTERIVEGLCRKPSQLTKESALKIIRNMGDQGSRFIHLEHLLGRGSSFVVSSRASERMFVHTSLPLPSLLIAS